MWDTYRLPAIGNFSLRTALQSFLAVLVGALLWVVAFGAPVQAIDATWQGNDITFEGRTYQPEPSPIPGLPPGTQAYVQKQPDQGMAHVLYFPGNADPAKSNPATLQDYRLENGQYGQAVGASTQVTIAAKGAANPDNPEQKEKTKCDVAGVGWIICNISGYVATGMDNIFGWIKGYLEVKPITSDTNSGLYKAWGIMLGLANGAFVLAFLVLIFSQVSGVGMSAYDLKKMVPRLIVASILVNASYYICAIGVDLSNIIGNSLQQALEDIRKSLSPAVPEASGWLSWKNVTEYILSGGTIAAAGVAGYTALVGGAVGGSISSLVFLLFPILVTGALAVLVALIVLAARQALITMLIVIAPFAFVAYLLPNTEKWFEKWRELFVTMLMVFPLFSLLFGGSQLASHIIIQNADRPSVVIFALFVQVAPLFVTPFLIKFSGSLLGRLAGMINNPQKGIIDSTKNWAKDRAELRSKAGMAAAANGRGTFLQKRAWKRDLDRRNREGLKKLYDNEGDAGWHEDKRYHSMHRRNKFADLRKSTAETYGDLDFEREKANNYNYQQLNGRKRTNEAVIKQLTQADEAQWQEALSEKMQADNRFGQFSGEARVALREQRIADSNAAIAQSLQKMEYAETIKNDPSLRLRVGGIEGELGAIKAKANATSEVVEAGMQAVKAIKQASDIKAGDVVAMERELRKAIDTNDIASMRAHTDMLAESANVGFEVLREVIKDKEGVMRSNPGETIEIFRHHVNSNATINTGAEDIGVWSRDSNNNYRTLTTISTSGGTWKNLNANQIAGMKASSQQLALNARKDDGTWALSQKMAKDIRNSPSTWAGIKDEMKELFIARSEGRG